MRTLCLDFDLPEAMMKRWFCFLSLTGLLMVGGYLQGAPTIQEMSPSFRSGDVDPMCRTVTVTFDQPMSRNASGTLVAKKSMEDGVGACPKVDEGRWVDEQTFELSVRLCPNQQYSFRLAGKGGEPYFHSVDGEVLPEIRFVFTTGDDSMEERLLRSYLKLGDAMEKLDKRGGEVDELFKAYESMSKDLEEVLDAYMDLKEKEGGDGKGERKLLEPSSAFTYDPTNGTVTISDVYRVKQ